MLNGCGENGKKTFWGYFFAAPCIFLTAHLAKRCIELEQFTDSEITG